MAKKAATKTPAKKRPAKRKPVEAVLLPLKSSSPWRRLLLGGGVVAGLVASYLGSVWHAGGWQIGPGPHRADSVSAVFDAQEAAFRRLNGELAPLLRAGQMKSEKAGADWIQERFEDECAKAWLPLLKEESAAFGGKDWTAEKQAAHIERYAR